VDIDHLETNKTRMDALFTDIYIYIYSHLRRSKMKDFQILRRMAGETMNPRPDIHIDRLGIDVHVLLM